MLNSKKNLIIGLVIIIGLVTFIIIAQKKAVPQAVVTAPVKVEEQVQAHSEAPPAQAAAQVAAVVPAPVVMTKAIPDITDVGEQNQFLKAISKNGRGLTNIDGYNTLLDCEKVLWKNYNVQGLCRKGGTCVCKDPKTCRFGACFIAMDPLPDKKKPVYLIRHLYRSLIGMEPGYKLLTEVRALSCIDAIKKIGTDRYALDAISQRELREKLNYYARAIWGKELSDDEQFDLAKKLIPLKFDRKAIAQVFAEDLKTKTVCTKWGW
ncbi:hypothetical protein CIK05_11370 [Bdellovibrio sp. qaytius]|nr:hypothetical protein CIK05_11370 [Bdellovibrio sp. qaytius]